jgi:hypothetical protein
VWLDTEPPWEKDLTEAAAVAGWLRAAVITTARLNMSGRIGNSLLIDSDGRCEE